MRKSDHDLTKQLQVAFAFSGAHWARHLWNGDLPPAVLTLQRKANSAGYHSTDAFVDRTHGDQAADEIAMNPDEFDLPDAKILATFAHEMTHHWQHAQGTPSRNGYHNREWAAEMQRIGLRPFNVKQPKLMTGYQLYHKIVPDGLFDTFCTLLLETGYTLQWRSRKATQLPPELGHDPEPTDGQEEAREEEKARKKNKVKYTCPGCNANVWGKPGLDVICGKCAKQFAAAQ